MRIPAEKLIYIGSVVFKPLRSEPSVREDRPQVHTGFAVTFVSELGRPRFTVGRGISHRVTCEKRATPYVTNCKNRAFPCVRYYSIDYKKSQHMLIKISLYIDDII